MRKIWNYRRTRPLAGFMAVLCLLLWQAPSAAALQKPQARPKHGKTQTPDAEQRKQIAAKEQDVARELDVRELSEKEMGAVRGRGAHRNAAFNGVLPWQKSFRDVNMCNGNLFKSFTDIQVSTARGSGLSMQRTYNSNDERVGPFGVGWTHAYDVRIDEAGSNDVPRTDFFGGKHTYKRDADGLYSPPSYMFDELSSDYDTFLADGPPEILSDDQKGMDGTVKHFVSGGTDADGTPSSERVLDSITDRHGNQTVFTYALTLNLGGLATKNLLTRVTDPSGRYLDFTWSNLGSSMAPVYRVTQVQGPFDASNDPIYTVSYEYNNDYNLWKVHQDPSGQNRTTTLTYTTSNGEAGLLASVADGLGHTVSYTYDIMQNLYSGPATDTVWVTSVTEPSSGGSLTWRFEIAMGSWGIWNVWASPTSTTDYHRDVSVTTDDHLRAAGVGPWNDVGWDTYWWEYDNTNNVTFHMSAWQDPRTWLAGWGGVATLATYGPHGNVLTRSLVTDYTYPNYSISNNFTTTYYDASKYFQKASVTDGNGNVTTFDYYDSTDASPGNRGETKWVRDARYGTTGQQFEYTYNSYGQKLSETNLNDVVTENTYGDTWGNLTQVVQDPGTGHLNRTTSMSYDVAGRLISSTDSKLQNSSFTYDGVGQTTQAILPGDTVSYSYGSNGRTESVTDGRGATSMTYETGNDRVASVTDPTTGVISYTYLPTGERQTMTLPGGGTWTYTYAGSASVLPEENPDKIRRMLLKVEDDQGRDVRYVLDTTGKIHEAISNITYQSGSPVSYVKTEYQYDHVPSSSYTRSNLAQLKNTWNYIDPMTGWQQSVLVQNDYTYDNNGNRLASSVSDSSGPIRTEDYSYDALNRLTGVDYGDGTTQGYTFDPMGNRLSKTENSASESYSYNNANMLLSRGASSYTNDANGNTLTGGGRTNTWDGENRLIECVTGTDTSTFVYGSDGLRRQATINGTTTDNILDGGSLVRERRGAYNVATYLQGVRGPEYRRNDNTGTVKWYLYDGLGSVLGEVDSSGNLTATRKYDVYGAVRASSGTSSSSHKFAGSLGHASDDETGLIYMQSRYLDPVTGTFVSEDPAKAESNWFSYCESNPATRCDPTGKSWVVAGDACTVAACLFGYMSVVTDGPASLAALALCIGFIASAIKCFCNALDGLPHETKFADEAGNFAAVLGGAGAWGRLAVLEIANVVKDMQKLGSFTGVVGVACLTYITGYACKVTAACLLTEFGF